jgi:hypothetical protein
MPWLLIVIVLFTTMAALAARTNDDRVLVLAVGEAVIVAYFLAALRRTHRPRAKGRQLNRDTDQRPLGS